MDLDTVSGVESDANFVAPNINDGSLNLDEPAPLPSGSDDDLIALPGKDQLPVTLSLRRFLRELTVVLPADLIEDFLPMDMPAIEDEPETNLVASDVNNGDRTELSLGLTVKEHDHLVTLT